MKLLLLRLALAALAVVNASGQAQWVHFGTNGALAYFSDDLTNHLIDYSYAGYGAGGVALPTNQPVMQTVTAIAGDNTANIQNAINAVGNLAPGANGVRGVVLLNPGTYEVDGVLSLGKSGVILRGSGTNNTVLNFASSASSGTAITIAGSSGASQVSGSSTYTISDAYVPLGATNFHLNSTSGLSVGTDIVVRRPWTTTWINAIGMSNLWSASGHQNDAERRIISINGTQVTVDIPLPTPIEQKWCTGTVFPYTDSGRVQQCGVENFSMVSIWGINSTGNTNGFGWTGVHFGNAKNCWVRDMAFTGFGPAINAATSSQTKWCTAQDSSYSQGVNNGSARPPAFEIDGQMCLFQRLNGVSGFEHLCQTADEATGPNVYLYCHATGTDFDGGPHRYWAVSLLTDNEYGTVGNVHIVIITGGNNGWGAGYSLFYNCHVNNFTVQCPAVDHHYNWWIGGSGVNNNPGTNPGTYDAAGTTVGPTSLYLEQLKERLGGAAVENIGYQLFTIAATPVSESVAAGSNATYTVTVGDPMSMSNTVVLNVSGLPPGASARFDTNSITGAGHTALTVTASNSIAPGSYTLSILGTSAGLTHAAAVGLVAGNASFSFTASPSAQSVVAGASTNFVASVVTNANFTGSVSFAVSGLPANTTAGFNPPSVSGSANTILTLTTAANTPLGTYTLTIAGIGATLTNTQAVTLAVTAGVVNTPGPFLWAGTNNLSANTNWSNAGNWLPAGPPGPLGNLQFFDSGAVSAVSNVNNVVDGNFVVTSLQYGNTNGNHTTFIAPGRTITIGGLTVGTETDNGSTQSVFTTITGPGGALVLSNVNSNLIVRQGSASSGSGLRATLDLSGLDTFNAELGRIEIGTLGSFARPSGTLYLARTNFITASGTSPAIQLGGQGGATGGNSGNGSFLYLGQTNVIFANGISVATVKQTGCSMLFNSALTNIRPSAYFRAADGLNPVSSWFIADSGSAGGTVNTSGTNDFTGGVVDALVSNLTVARSSTGTGNGNPFGLLTFSAGTMNIGTLEIGYQGASGANIATGVVNVNGTAVLVVNSALELAHTNGGAGAASTSGTLNLNGGTVQATNIFGGGGTGTINLNTGMLDLQAGRIANVSTLNIGAAGDSNPARLQNAASLSAANPITIASNGVLAGNTLITSPSLIVNGVLSPGLGGVGWITNNGALTLAPGGQYNVGISDALGGRKIGWDFAQVNGAINLPGITAGQAPFTVQLQSLAGSQPGTAANFSYSTNYDWAIASAGGGITNFSAAIFSVDDSFFQNDLGGGYFYLRTNGNSLNLSFTNNHPPLAGPITWYQTANVTAVPIARLAPYWTDPDGDPVALFLVHPDSANGANNVGTDGTYIYYTNGAQLPDTVTYLVQDVRTNPPALYRVDDTVQTALGTIHIIPPPVVGGITLTESNLYLSGAGGISGGNYYLLSSTNISLPLTQWTPVATNTFDANGNFSLTNSPNGNVGQSFYRLEMLQ